MHQFMTTTTHQTEAKPQLAYLNSDIVFDEFTLANEGKIVITVNAWYGPRKNATKIQTAIQIPKTIDSK